MITDERVDCLPDGPVRRQDFLKGRTTKGAVGQRDRQGSQGDAPEVKVCCRAVAVCCMDVFFFHLALVL